MGYKQQGSIHVWVRLLCGISLIATALIYKTWLAGLLQLLLVIVLLRYWNHSWQGLFRSWKLLRWFVFPILIFHVFFTPGIAVFPGAYISVEGLERGAWLALRLIVIFISALVLMQILVQKEWLRLLAVMPVVGSYASPYVLLLSPLYDASRSLMTTTWQQWNQDGKPWRKLGDMLTCMIQSLMIQSQSVAQKVWHDWDQHIDILLQEPPKHVNAISSLGVLILAIGWVSLFMFGL